MTKGRDFDTSQPETATGIAQPRIVLESITRILAGVRQNQTERELGLACLAELESVTESTLSFIGEIGPDGCLHDIAINSPGMDSCTVHAKTGHHTPPGAFPIHGIYSRVLADAKSLIANDPAGHPDHAGPPAGHPPLKSFLGVPLIRDGVTIGMIGLGNRAGGYRRADLDIAETLVPVIVEAFDRKRAEQALRANESTMRGILDATKESIWLFSPDGIMLEGNKTAWLRFGKPPQEVVGKHFNEILPPELAQSRLAQLLKTVESKEPLEFEDERAGIVFRHDFYPVLDAKGHVSSVACFSRDITQSRQSEESLRRAHERLVLAQQSAGAGLWDWDMTTGRLEWSPELFHLFHLDPSTSEASFEIWNKVLHPEDRPAAQERIEQAIANHTPLVNEYRIVTPAGEVRWLNARGDTTYNAQGQAVRMLGICLDITERKRAEEEREGLLKELEQRAAETEGVFAAQQDAVLVYDTEMNVRRANPSFLEVYGFDPVGLNVKEIIQRVECRLADGRPFIFEEQPTPRALHGERVAGVAFGVTRADGTRTIVETSSGPLITGGRITGSVTVWHDISERVRHEHALRKFNRALLANSHSDQAMMRAKDESAYLQEICRIVMEDCGHAMVWIGFAEHDDAKRVRPVASAGFEQGYLDTLRITWADTERGQGPTGSAVRTGKPCGCSNMLTDPRFVPWREEALGRGYASSLALPLMAGSETLGAITIYAKEAEAFDEEEIKLLSDLADDLAFGMVTLRMRAAHAAAAALLAQSEERYRTLFNAMTEGFMLCEIVVDANGVPCDFRALEINPAFERLTGLKEHQVVGHTFYEVLPQENKDWVNIYDALLRTGEAVHLERYLEPLGRWYEFYSYRTAPDQFAVIFTDISGRKQAEMNTHTHIEELRAMNEELTRFNRAATGRELRMIELKKQVNELSIKAGQAPPYPLEFEKEPA